MSFYTSLTGLNAAAAELAVASNNIANSSTTSFKRSDASFGDIFAVSASSHMATALGSGVQLIGVDQQFSQGGLELTDNALDIAISGDGFFPVAAVDGTKMYTRNGSFMLNEDNLVVNSAGHILQVHPLGENEDSDFNQGLQGLSIERTIAPEPTTSIAFNVKLPESAAVIGTAGDTAIDPNDPTTFNQAQSMTLYDDAGESYTATVYYQKIGDNVANGANTEDQWRASIYIGDADVPSNTLTFDFDQDGVVTAAIADQIVAASPVDGRTQAITVGFEASTHTKGFEIASQIIDGLPQGELVNINVQEDGVVMAIYSNGSQLTSGRINLANFTSPKGLNQQGSTIYTATDASGALTFGEPGTSGVGKLAGGAKERSNVDLTDELVKLISAQRNFQSNAKALETSGTLTSTLINMRG
jgi:flagellar hook protein FlgE